MPKVTALLRRLAPLLLTLAFTSLAAPARAQNVLVTAGNGSIISFNPATGGNSSTFASGGLLNGPASLAFGPDGNVFVQSAGSILQFNGQTGAFINEFIAPGTGGMIQPDDILFSPTSGNLLVADPPTNTILQFNGDTGAFIDDFVAAGSGGLLDPKSFQFSPTTGNLFVVSRGTNSVLQFNGQTGAFINQFVAPDSGGLTDAAALTFNESGDLFVLDADDNSVLRFNGSTGAFESVFVAAGGAGQSGGTALALGPDGNLYVLDNGGNAIRRFNGQTGAFLGSQPVPADAGGVGPQFFAFLPQGGGGGTRYILLNGPFAGAQVETEDDGTTVGGLINQQTNASGTITPPAAPGGLGTFTGTFGTNQRTFTALVIAYDDAPNVVQALSDAVMSNLTALVAYQGRLDPATPFIQRLPAVQTNITQTITALQLAASLTRNGFWRVLILGAIQRINQINRLINNGLANRRPSGQIGQLLVLTQLNTQQAFRLAVQQTLHFPAP